jgi:hypothetical protein
MKPKKKRKLVRPLLGGKIRDIVWRTTWYTKIVNSTQERVDFKRAVTRRGKSRAMAIAQDLAGGQLVLPVIKPSRVTKADKLIEHRQQLTYMSTNWEDRRVLRGRYLYQFDCQCGSRIILTGDEALDRDDLGLGCGRKSCRVPAFDRQMWYRPTQAFQLQLRQLREMFPEKVVGLSDPFDIESVVTALMEDRRLAPDIRDGKYWISEVADSEELLQDKLILTYMPDPALFPDGELMVRLGNWPVTINELCEVYNLNLDRALDYMLLATDEQLIDELIGEQL